MSSKFKRHFHPLRKLKPALTVSETYSTFTTGTMHWDSWCLLYCWKEIWRYIYDVARPRFCLRRVRSFEGYGLFRRFRVFSRRLLIVKLKFCRLLKVLSDVICRICSELLIFNSLLSLDKLPQFKFLSISLIYPCHHFTAVACSNSIRD